MTRLGEGEGWRVAVKDNICTKGTLTTAGSKVLNDYYPRFNADVIEKLKDAVIVGKTSCDEFGMGSRGDRCAFGKTVNPVDPLRSPGGSSSGSAVAVKADLADVALGSDTGGSIRLPASWCGLVGFKPSYGTVSRRGLIAYCSSTDVIGPIAKDVHDAKRLFDMLVTGDARDETCVGLPPSEGGGEEALVRIGILDHNEDPIWNAVRDRLLAAVAMTAVPWPTEFFERTCAAYHVIAASEASSNLARFVFRSRPTNWENLTFADVPDLGEEPKRRATLGRRLLGDRHKDNLYQTALRIRADVPRHLNDLDVLLTPVAYQHTAPLLDDDDHIIKRKRNVVDPFVADLLDDLPPDFHDDELTAFASLAGLPAIALPVGHVDNLPVGVQLVASRPFTDRSLLALAGRLEASLGPPSALL